MFYDIYQFFGEGVTQDSGMTTLVSIHMADDIGIDPPPYNNVVGFNVEMMGMNNDGDAIIIKHDALLKYYSGSLSLIDVGAPRLTSSPALAGVDSTIDTDGNSIRTRASGIDGMTIQWHCNFSISSWEPDLT